MWTTVVISATVFNVLLFAIHLLGPKGMLFTWVPGRTILLIWSLLHKTELYEAMRYTWASGVLPVAFLLPLHLGVRIMYSNGRHPRFECSNMWLIIWTATLLILTLAVYIIGTIHSEALQLILGIVAIFLNIVNINDAPQNLKKKQVEFTVGYVLASNVIIVGALIFIHMALDRGELVLAGLLSNIPLMAFVLIAGSTCKATPESLQLTGQHIYMMSYQIWPNMAFIGTLWATFPLGADIAFVLAIISMVIVLVLQYFLIKRLFE